MHWIIAFIFYWMLSASSLDVAAQSETEPLVISAGQGIVTFHVEIADTPSERAQGLMHRTKLGADRGMLFDFKKDGPVSMWMRNTFIPLDMVFIDRHGRVVNIIANVQPLTEESRWSEGAVRAVLELPAGTAERIGLTPGDALQHRIFQP